MSFTGGYIFKQFEGAAEPVVHEFPLPETVILPLAGSLPVPFVFLVAEGSVVRAGENLLEYGDPKHPLLSPVNGVIQAIDDRSISIHPSPDSPSIPVSGHPRQPWHMERAEREAVFRDSGCSLLFGDRFTAGSDFGTVRRIIVNAVHNSPLDQAWKPEMHGDRAVFPSGLRALKALFPNAEIVLAINKRNRGWFSAPEITGTATVRVMSDRYPQELPALLARHIGGDSATGDSGSVFVLSFEEVIQAAECLTLGKPFRDRIVLVAGPGAARPGWHRIPLGTTFGEIRRRLVKGDEHGPWRIIRGSLFCRTTVADDSEYTGYSDTAIMVIREFAEREFYRFLNPGFDYDSYSQVTFCNYIPLMKRRLDSNVHGGVRPCVQCNFCDEVCPSGLYPHLIWKHVQAGLVEESFRLRPHACVECGLCDYVCPSKISISPSVKKAGDKYRERRKA